MMTILSHPLRAILIILILIFCPYSASIQAEDSEKFDETWQHIAVKELFNRPLGNEEAMIFHLDTNGFAVRLPSQVMIFDYDNEKPCPQSDKESDIGIVKSLLTGVINPQELENESVIFFFSHAHPAKKLLKLLKWKDKVREILFVVPEEIYAKYESMIQDLIEEEEFEFEKKDIPDLIKQVKADRTYSIKGNVLTTKNHRHLKNTGGEPYPGLEYSVHTKNNLTLYHSGSFLCRHCVDVQGMCERNYAPEGQKSKNSFTIDSKTKHMRFVNGKLVSASENEELDNPAKTAGDNRIAFAVYSDPEKPSGNTYIVTSFVPEFALGGTLIYRFGTTDDQQDMFRKQREKNHFLETDRFLANRNPEFKGELYAPLTFELESKRIKEYFDGFVGNSDLIQTLKNTTLARYQNYTNKIKQNCKDGSPVSPYSTKCNLREFATRLHQFDGYQPNVFRGNCYPFTTEFTHVPRGSFFGYWGSTGYPLFSGESIEKIYQEYK